MYTQCPECQTAFRVTAQVLQQAAGRVRCGGCGIAFNALHHLSEDMPKKSERARHMQPVPSSVGKDTGSRNAELLQKLDELAGDDDVLIEDTGVEWRVLTEQPDEGAAGEFAQDAESPETGPRRRSTDTTESSSVEHAGQASLEFAEPQDIRAQAPDDVMRFDDNTPLPDDFDDGEEPVYEPPQRRAEDKQLVETAHFDEMQVDLALGELDDWVELLDEVGDEAFPDQPDGSIPLEVEEELAAIHSELSARPANRPEADRHIDTPADLDAQFDMQAEAMGIEPSGRHKVGGSEVADTDDAAPVDDGEADSEAPGPDLDSTADFEAQIATARSALEGDGVGDDDAGLDVMSDELANDAAVVDGEEIPELIEGVPPDDPSRGDDASGGGELILTLAEDAEVDTASAAAHDLTLPADAGESSHAAAGSSANDPFDQFGPHVETIIMEGESVRGYLEEAERDSPPPAPKPIETPEFLADTYALNRDKVRGGRRRSDPPGLAVIAGVVMLVLVLAGQIVHASRQTLSTYPAFNHTVGPLYRMLGRPITPDWDVSGWQFQTTNGAIDEDGRVLTIYSTIVNRSSRPLPYPLVHVSLTDRWEEVIGSRVLEPHDYLAGDLDPSKPVTPGETFKAVISIDGPSEDATGFKLNVCYRVAPGRVRCATGDFKD